jgi:hypothetical protein
MSQSRFNDYGLCWCDNRIEGTMVPISLRVAGRSVAVESVPKGVCNHCHFTYYRADILETLEALLREDRRERRCNSGPI